MVNGKEKSVSDVCFEKVFAVFQLRCGRASKEGTMGFVEYMDVTALPMLL